MFTGLVQCVGSVASVKVDLLAVDVSQAILEDAIALGESIAVNGACLTVVEQAGVIATFEVSQETFARTNLGDLRPGSSVNIERALRVGDRLGGHIVQGHVDCVGKVVGIEPKEKYAEFRFEAPAEFDRYLVDKGSVVVDGISLTVVNPKDGVFSVWVIPHTAQNTNLSSRKVGDRINLEFDAIAKYVEKLVIPYRDLLPF